ncbi:hypothetical protein G7054_g5882 [Neopestalotiopsis clavispora]|nr:hypothetical protein G7054_g5882 [Neopestalotiopsis clavispora]
MLQAHQTKDKDRKAMTTQLQNARIIGNIISQSMQDLSDARCRWSPHDVLFRDISPQAVNDFFRFRPELPGNQQPQIAETVRRITPPIDECRCNRPHCTGGRIIFATLVSLSRPELIIPLFQGTSEAFCDADLVSLPRENYTLDAPNQLAVALLRGLSTEELDCFTHFTWQMRSPYVEELRLQLSVGDNWIVELPENVSLPWVSLSDAKDTYDEATTVQRMVIHPFHRKPDLLEGNLALKVIFDDRYENEAQEAYLREVQANGIAPQHSRIVPLLAAFKYRGKFHLVLPWARGGNLADLFKKYATSISNQGEEQQVADWYTDQWLLAQCLGLADGLAAVHGKTDNPHTSAAQIHADIKPENILCFAPGEGENGPFELKLADFGVAQVVSPETGTIQVKRVPHTKTYRPPEHDTDETLRLNYDVWCLGCVYLEFLTWAIAGYEALNVFEKARLEERDDRRADTAGPKVSADTFFKKTSARLSYSARIRIKIDHTSKTIQVVHDEDENDDKNKDEVKKVEQKKIPRSVLRRWHQWSLKYSRNTRVKAVIKTEVKLHINFLRQQSKSEELSKFLTFIESRMLVIDATKRASSEDVHEFLESLH